MERIDPICGCNCTIPLYKYRGFDLIHILLHFVVPLMFALAFWRNRWWQSYLLLLCGLIIDIDHLLADPIYDPERCSIGFHPLHSGYAMGLYAALLLASVYLSRGQPHSSWWSRLRLILFGIVLHLILDAGDCIF